MDMPTLEEMETKDDVRPYGGIKVEEENPLSPMTHGSLYDELRTRLIMENKGLRKQPRKGDYSPSFSVGDLFSPKDVEEDKPPVAQKKKQRRKKKTDNSAEIAALFMALELDRKKRFRYKRRSWQQPSYRRRPFYRRRFTPFRRRFTRFRRYRRFY
jgi:hypothetical protein